MVVGSPTKLNLIPSGVMPVVYINQGDAGYDKEFLIYNGDSPYNVPSGVSATIRGTKADGYGVTEAATVTTGSNLVTVTITEQMVAAAGENLYELVFVDTNDLRVASINMAWAVKKDALGDAVISDSDLDYATTVMDTLQSVAAFKNQLDTNTDGLAAETAARIAADNTLQSNINTEALTRAAADSTLQRNIDVESSSRAAQDAVLQAEINQLVAPSGSAPSAAEVQDARIGADGATYSTLGVAIRTQAYKAYEAMRADVEQGKGTFFAIGDFQSAGLTAAGALNPSQRWRMSNSNPLVFNRDITISVKSGFRFGYVEFKADSTTPWRGWYTADATITANTSFVLQIARVSENTSETSTIAEFVGALSFDSMTTVNSERITAVSNNLFANIASGTKSWDFTDTNHIEEYFFVAGNRYVFTNNTSRNTGALYLRRKDGTELQITAGVIANSTFTYIPEENFYGFRVYMNSAGVFEISDDGIIKQINNIDMLSRKLPYDIVPQLSWVQGSINSSGGESYNTAIIRTAYYDVSGIEKLTINSDDYWVGWHLYDETKTHIVSSASWVKTETDLLIGNASYIRFNIRLVSGADFTPADFDPDALAIMVGYTEEETFINGQTNVSEYNGKIDISNKFRHTTFVEALRSLFTPTATLPTRRQQGTAVYNGVMFNLFDQGGLSILDLAERSVINEYTLDVASADNHMNNAGFGDTFYSGNTQYPLMYISECYGNHSCFVENVTDSSATLVQTITFNNANGDYANSSGVAFDWMIDPYTGKLMTYGLMSNGKHKIKVFNIPAIGSATVSLTEADVLDQWVVEDYLRGGFTYTYQGSCAYSGMIYLVCYNPNKIICVNELTHEVTAEVPLTFVSGEPEGIGIDDGVMYLTTWNNADTTIYAMQF